MKLGSAAAKIVLGVSFVALNSQTAALAQVTITKIVQSGVTSASNPNQTGPIGPATAPNGTGTTGTAVLAGTQLTYRIAITNNGPSSVFDVSLTEVVPSGLETPPGRVLGAKFVSATSVGAVTLTCGALAGVPAANNPRGNGGTFACTAPSLAPAAVAALDVVVSIDPATKASLVDQATLSFDDDEGEPLPAVAATLTTPLLSVAQLTVTKIVQSGVTSASNPNQTGPIGPATAPNGSGTTGTAVLAGTPMTYRIVITNTGPSDASDVNVTEVLPSGLETPPGRVLGAKFVSATSVGAVSLTCGALSSVPAANNPQGNGGTLVCSAPLMAQGQSAALDVVVFVDPATRAGLVDVATVEATEDSTPGTATLTTPVAAVSDLVLTKTHDPDPVVAGATFTYSITVTNNGPSAARPVSVVDTLPPFQKVVDGDVIESLDGNGNPSFDCAATPPIGSPGNTSSISCLAFELPPNKTQTGTANPAGTATIVLTVLQDPAGPGPTVQNCATAQSSSTDPVPGNGVNVCDTVAITSFVVAPIPALSTAMLVVLALLLLGVATLLLSRR